MAQGKERGITRREFIGGSLFVGAAALGVFVRDQIVWGKEQVQIEAERVRKVRTLLADTLNSSRTENLDLFEISMRRRLIDMVFEKRDDLFSIDAEKKERSRWEIAQLAFVSYARSSLPGYDQVKETMFYRDFASFLEKAVNGIGLDNYGSHSVSQIANTWVEASFRSMAVANFSKNDPTVENVTITYKEWVSIFGGAVLGEVVVPLQRH